MVTDDLSASPLGKKSAYADHYDASLLFAIPRQLKRTEIGLTGNLPFHGVDIWNAYELSWLNPKGKPCVAAAMITVPADSPNIFESKSAKLYFNSFNQTQFKDASEVQQRIAADLSRVTGSTVKVELILPAQFGHYAFTPLPGKCLDELDIAADTYQTDPALLTTHTKHISETVHSYLLKSNCLITSQPDWGSVIITYTGKQIDHEGLLKYLISFRQHNEFHEQCVERIFTDIMRQCAPEQLTVYGRYTRRGGLDINPFRSTTDAHPHYIREYRQ